jgi:hypothetical protein
MSRWFTSRIGFAAVGDAPRGQRTAARADGGTDLAEDEAERTVGQRGRWAPWLLDLKRLALKGADDVTQQLSTGSEVEDLVRRARKIP